MLSAVRDNPGWSPLRHRQRLPGVKSTSLLHKREDWWQSRGWRLCIGTKIFTNYTGVYSDNIVLENKQFFSNHNERYIAYFSGKWKTETK